MKLPRGITGFHGLDEALTTITDLASFRGHCYEAARRASGQIESFSSPDAPGDCRNYAIGTFVLPPGRIAVVLNLHHAFITFVDPPAEGSVLLRFRDCPLLADAFNSFGSYQVLTAAQLEKPPSSSALYDLADVERKKVAYWKPRRVGDIVFNCWD